jgi:hypothetical protein
MQRRPGDFAVKQAKNRYYYAVRYDHAAFAFDGGGV